MSSIILVRHGESLGNVNPEYYKLPDVANILSMKGVDQCAVLSKTFHEYMEDDYYRAHTTVISSVFQRAKITAQIVMSGHPHQIIHDNRINECVHGQDNIPRESSASVIKRMKSLLASYEFNLICFTHGMFMGKLDPAKGGARNAEVRKYDRDEFIDMLDGKVAV